MNIYSPKNKKKSTKYNHFEQAFKINILVRTYTISNLKLVHL